MNVKVWKLDAIEEKYDCLIPVNDISIEELKTYDGRSHEGEWIGRKVVPNVDENKNVKLGDYTDCWFIPVFSEKAIKELYDLIKKDAEIIHLECDYGDFSLINVTAVLEAFDCKNSKFDMFKGSDRIMYVEKYAFFSEIVKGHNIFKTTAENLGPVFVSDEFVQTVKRSKLKGFRFELAWDSEVPTTI